METNMTDTYIVNKEGLNVIEKTPGGKLDYPFDWTQWLDDVGDTIVDKEVTVQDGIVLESSSISASKKVIAWISGGEVGKTYWVTCKITTASVPPRIDERTIYIKIIAK